MIYWRPFLGAQFKFAQSNLLPYLLRQKNTDLFEDAGSINAVANVVDEFEETDAESLERSIFYQRRVMKIKVDEDGLCQ